MCARHALSIEYIFRIMKALLDEPLNLNANETNCGFQFVSQCIYAINIINLHKYVLSTQSDAYFISPNLHSDAKNSHIVNQIQICLQQSHIHVQA